MEELNGSQQQQQQYLEEKQNLTMYHTANNASQMKNMNENEEYEIKGKSQSTDTSENYGYEQTKPTQHILNTIKPPNNSAAPAAATQAVANRNEETENAAMVDADAAKMRSSATTPLHTNSNNNNKKNKTTTENANNLALTTVPTTITTLVKEKSTQPNLDLKEFAVPVIPPNRKLNSSTSGCAGAAAGGVGGSCTGAKKKRTKGSAKHREENETRNVGKSNKAKCNNTVRGVTTYGSRCQGNDTTIMALKNSNVSGVANMKSSVSMTSLPPDDEKTEESRDVIKAKLRVERPYNSLKKNIERNVVGSTLGVKPHCYGQNQSCTSSCTNHRYSWGSGYSYSSSSLQSSATTLGLGSAKDDLWAVIQANYNYIMDTNLLDSCKETERHLAEQCGTDNVDCEESLNVKLLGVTQQRETSWHDPRELRKWLRDMEERLENAPTLSAATTLTITQLQSCLADHSVLYNEIVSHARVVNACIRLALEKHQGEVQLQLKQKQQQQNEEKQPQSPVSSSTIVGERTCSTSPPTLNSGETILSQLAFNKEEDQEPLSLDSCGTIVAEHLNSSPTRSTTSPTPQTPSHKGDNNNLSRISCNSGLESVEGSPLSAAKSLDTVSSDSLAEAVNTKFVEESLERLQNRYHLLYLKAFEVQLCLDGLLRKKGSNASIPDATNDCIDDDEIVNCPSSDCEEDVGSDVESEHTHNSSSVCELQDCGDLEEEERDSSAIKADCEDGDDEGEEDEDEVGFGRNRFARTGRGGYNTVLVTFDKRLNSLADPTRPTTLTDFEADSESSDWEISQQHQQPQLSMQRKSYNINNSTHHLYQQQQPHHYFKHEEYSNDSNLFVTTVIGEGSGSDVTNQTQLAPDIHTSDTVNVYNNRHHHQYHPVATNGLVVHKQREIASTSTTPTPSMSLKTKMNNLHTDGDNEYDEQQQQQHQHQMLVPMNASMFAADLNTSTASNTSSSTISTATQTQQKLQILHNNQQVGVVGTPAIKQKSIAVISPNSHNNKSPTVLRKRQQQHQHHTDISKFNRSNRKSKNCAVFYFKHLDTDNETNCSSIGDAADLTMQPDGLSSSASQTSEHHLLKSADASSDDDGGWLYSSVLPPPPQTDALIGECARNGDKENKGNNSCITTIVIDGVQSSAVSSSSPLTIETTTTKATTLAVVHADSDSDKENKEASVTTLTTTQPAATATVCCAVQAQSVDVSSSLSTQSRTQITHAEIHLTPVSKTAKTTSSSVSLVSTEAPPSSSVGRIVAKGCAASCSSGSGSSSYSTRSSSCSSNDLLTETTSATNTTQITQMHFQRMHRTEMELQIAGNCNNSEQMIQMRYGDATASGGVGAITAITANSANNNNSNNNSDVDNCNNMKNNNDRNKNNNTNNNSDGSSSNKLDNNGNYNSGNSNQQRNAVLDQQQQLSLEKHQQQQPQKNEISYTARWLPKKVSASTSKTPSKHQPQQQQQQIETKRSLLLPPRSPNKSTKTVQSIYRGDNASGTSASVTKGKLSHESIKQLVLEAEHLVRDAEALKTPNKQKQKHSVIKLSSTVKKREIVMPGPIKQRVQEWLEHQPATPVAGHRNLTDDLHTHNASSKAADDCEASGEASETDSVPQPGSDTSEELTESIATCMQTSTNSYGGNSTECFGGSAEPILSPSTVLGYGSSNQSLNVKVVKRPQTRRKSERPWSVSCLSQLTTETVQTTTAPIVSSQQASLATHSISESALDSLSPGRQRGASSSSTTNVTHVKSSTSKGSLKRRKTRKKKVSTSGNTGIITASTHTSVKQAPGSGSEDTAEVPRLAQTLLMKSSDSMFSHQIREITSALLNLQRSNVTTANEGAVGGNSGSAAQTSTTLSHQVGMQQQSDMGDEAQLMKPNFRVGSYTTAYMRNEKRLGSLAALATYMNDEEEEQQGDTGTEDHHSSFSETAWDNYQEKYNSENYSEGFDSDAARRLMEFGDDYRNFIDSQSDCCSSLSAANNLDSLSPPRMDSLPPVDTKLITQDTIANSVDHARRRRALDLEYERRRKTLETRRKSCQDSIDLQHTQSPVISMCSSSNTVVPKFGFEKMAQHQQKSDTASRKLEFNMQHAQAQSLRRTSESDTSTRRRRVDERRRSSRNLDKSIKLIPATSSSSGDDSADEKDLRKLLQQSRSRLEDTEALKTRCHLLRPEDYTEIIKTCRDNLNCLEAVLRGPPGTVVSAHCAGQTKDILAAWEDLLGWSENAASARKMQEEMIILKHSINKLGNKSTFELLDTEPQIQITIEALQEEKLELQNYRTKMLQLNISVHSWLTRQERRLQNALAEEELKKAADKVSVEEIIIGNKSTLEEVDAGKSLEKDNTTSLVANDGTVINSTTATSTTIGTSSMVTASRLLDIQTLINSESEFHKHLKNEVSDLYSAWDDADARISTQLETLTNSLIAWRQLENGLYEFQQSLGHDRGTLKGLEGALDKGHATPGELAQNVKVVAKLLSERVQVSQEQLTAVQEHLDPNHILNITKFTASNGCYSDSGISDGATSDGGLSERERRLGVLRRLVKQLEQALAPGSEAMKSIAVRMESAEAELKNLQNTCRDLIVRTAATHQNKKIQQQLQQTEAQQLQVPGEESDSGERNHHEANIAAVNGHAGGKQVASTHSQNGALKQTATNKRNGRRKQSKRTNRGEFNNGTANTHFTASPTKTIVRSGATAGAPDSGDPADDPHLEFDLDAGDKKHNKNTQNSWAWRIAKAAVPMQLALITFLCAACLMQPNCCDNLNNLSMSFTPQLRYIRGPPPI